MPHAVHSVMQRDCHDTYFIHCSLTSSPLSCGKNTSLTLVVLNSLSWQLKVAGVPTYTLQCGADYILFTSRETPTGSKALILNAEHCPQ